MSARLKAKMRGFDPRDRGSNPRRLSNNGRLKGIGDTYLFQKQVLPGSSPGAATKICLQQLDPIV